MIDYNEPQKAKVIDHIKAIIAELEYLLHDDDGELGERPSWRHVQEVNIH